MADITVRNQGQVSDEGKQNWRGDQVAAPQGGQSIYQTSTVKLADLGSRKVVGDRVFRYTLSGDTIAAGLIASAMIHDAKWLKTTIGTDWVVGARIVALYASTNVAAGAFNEGYLWVAQGTNANEGYMYRVKSHGAGVDTEDYEVTLYDPIQQTADVSDKCSIIPNLYNGVIENTTEVNPAMGIVPLSVVSGDYFWMQTWGPAAVQCGSAGVPATGAPITIGSAGMAETTAGTQIVGVCLNTGSALDSALCFINIAP